MSGYRLSLLALALAFGSALPVLAAGLSAGEAGNRPQAAEDGIRGQITQNWNAVPGLPEADKVRIRIRMKLDRSGQIIGKPEMTASGGPEGTRKALAASAYRAVIRSVPFKNLPLDKYDAWKEVTVNFDAGAL